MHKTALISSLYKYGAHIDAVNIEQLFQDKKTKQL